MSRVLSRVRGAYAYTLSSGAGVESCPRFSGEAGRVAGVLDFPSRSAQKALPSPAPIGVCVAYDATEIFVVDWRACGDFELADTPRPASGSGTAITWNTVQTDPYNDVYWFAAYNYYADLSVFELIPHPTQGVFFADDDVPPNLDEVEELGAFGFDRPGRIACPIRETPLGACCSDDGHCEFRRERDCSGLWHLGPCSPNPCEVLIGACCSENDCTVKTREECDDLGGSYMGEGSECEPNPCVVPTRESSWGAIKGSLH